jgi:hypothetical protein
MGRREMNTGLYWSNQKQEDDLENLDLNRRNIIKEIGWKGVDWIHLAQDRNIWELL